MKARIIKIGNSRGIRIPKALIEQTGISGEVEISVRRNALIIRAVDRPRARWESQFKTMAEHGDGRLLDGDVALDNSFDQEEWEWE